mmetsp:Transcript_57671/g.100966  ORF Transcript_57671/g.100966 Transcript_57671/m.100966 type:complete len:102 (-) Transcript_57671:816-1121(-)
MRVVVPGSEKNIAQRPVMKAFLRSQFQPFPVRHPYFSSLQTFEAMINRRSKVKAFLKAVVLKKGSMSVALKKMFSSMVRQELAGMHLPKSVPVIIMGRNRE